MIRLNKKFLISIIALLVLFATVFAVLSFTLADESTDNKTLTADANTANGPVSVIDYIIEFSNSTDPDIDKTYHVLELGSSDKPSDLEALISSDGFRKYVINENKSESYTGEMTAGADKIEYIYYNVTKGNQAQITVTRTTDANGVVSVSTNKTSVSDETIIDSINKADLIYLSNDPDTRFVKGNDFSEAVKIALNAYATGNHRPLIIDSHRLTIQSIIAGTHTMSDIASTDFKKYGNKYATKMWDDSLDAETFMNPTRMDFVGINGSDAQGRWLKYDDGTGVKNTAKVLTICNGASDVDLTTKIRAGITTVATINATSTDAINNSELAGLDLNNLYELPDTSALHKYSYRGRSVRPDYVYFDTLALNDADGMTNLANIDLSSYDFILIESGTKTVDFSHNKDAEDNLLSAMYGGVHILYSSSLYVSKDDVTIPENTADNYKDVYEKVATSTDVGRYDFILVGTRKRMSSFSKATTGDGVKAIADIINAGDFRNVHGNSSGDSSNVYTALEIEPGYPIDTTLANIFNGTTDSNNQVDIAAIRDEQDPLSLYQGNTKSFADNSFRGNGGHNIGKTGGWGDYGFYYLRTDSVLDATTDEISYDGVNSLTTMLEQYNNGDSTLFKNSITKDNAEHVQDYYRWNLSKAKVAHALGVSYDEVNVVHMSSAEFAASKVSLLDNYDMIYIGGNSSNLAEPKTLNSYKNAEVFYRMYRHNGDTYVGYNNSSNAQYPDKYNGYVKDTVGVMLGNDITDDKLKELKGYVDSGMPVVIDKDVTLAFDSNADIDPYSNMYDFLSYANQRRFRKADNSGNALWGFDYDSTIKVANDNGKYGKTYGGYATVFGGLALDMSVVEDENSTSKLTGAEVVDEKYLSPLIKECRRPLFALTVMPKKYVEGDPTSYIRITDFNFKVNLTNRLGAGETARVRVFIDDDSNNRFTENNPKEVRLDEPLENGKGEYSVKLPSDYFGVVYWKFEVDVYKSGKNDSGEDVQVLARKSSTTGTCKIANDNNDKMVIDLLEIMPVVKKNSPSTNNSYTLSFCTECDMSKTIYTGNRYAQTAYNSHQLYIGQTGYDTCGFVHDDGSYADTVGDVVKKIESDNYYKLTTSSSSPAIYTTVNDYLKYTYEGNNLGVHDHKFGIVKYDTTLSKPGYNNGRAGMDDMTSNWFDDIRDDYEVNLTMLTTSEYDALVDMVNSFYADTTIDDEVLAYRRNERKSELIENYKNSPDFDSALYASKSDEDIWNGNAALRNQLESDADLLAGINQEYRTKYYSNKFKAEYEKYNAYATTIRNMLDGKSASAVGLPFVIDESDKYSSVVSELDTYLGAKDSTGKYTRASEISSNYDSVATELAHATDSSIPGSERNYYDLYMLVGSENSFYATDGTFSKDFKIWRNAKIYELYFEKLAQKYKILSSVNLDGKYKNQYKLNGTFNCVVLGAAVDFTIDGKTGSTNNGQAKTDDLTENSCSTLLDYAENDGNILLFHGSLTAAKGCTENMSRLLREAFGQDPRHLEYSNNTASQRSNVINLKVGNKTKKITLEPDVNTVTVQASAGDIKTKDQTVYFVCHYMNNKPDQTSKKITIPSTLKKGKLNLYVSSSQSTLMDAELITDSSDNTGSAHNIELTVTVCSVNNGDMSQGYNTWNGSQVNEMNGVEMFLNDKAFSDAGNMTGNVVSIPNGEMSGFSIGEPVVTSRYGDEADQKDADGNKLPFDSTTQINQQKLIVKYVDKDGHPVDGTSITASNITTGDVETGVTGSGTNETGEYVFTGSTEKYKNYSSSANSLTKVSAKSGYSNNEYFISPTLGNKVPNTYTLTPYKALRDFYFDNGGNTLLPFKYTSFSNQMSAEQAFQRQQDNRDKVHNGLNETTDRTSQTNKGIVTMYPFIIGDQMKVSGTEPQSYAVDVENQDLTVYYTLAGGTIGTVSSYYCADPHNGQDNYFIYQLRNITYCGAGHSNVTGYGKDNNDERRLFINIIVNSARKSTAAPDLTLHDVDSYYDTTSKKNVTYNKVIEKCFDGSADYVTYISDYADNIEFKFLPQISEGAQLSNVIAWYDKNRTDAEKNKYTVNTTDSSLSDPLIYEHGYKANFVDHDVLTKVGLGEEGLKTDASGNPVINLKPEYFDASDTAYIGVQVTDDKGNSVTKMLKIKFKPSLLDLN